MTEEMTGIAQGTVLNIPLRITQAWCRYRQSAQMYRHYFILTLTPPEAHMLHQAILKKITAEPHNPAPSVPLMLHGRIRQCHVHEQWIYTNEGTVRVNCCYDSPSPEA